MRSLTCLLLACALAIAACGDDGGGGGAEGVPGPAALLAAALDNADDSESYRSTFTMKSDLGGERFEISGDLRSNADSTRARGPVEGVYTGQRVEFEMLLLEDELFMRGGTWREILPEGKEWVRMRDKTLAQQSLTPTQLVDLLRDTPDVKEVGTKTVRGKETVQLRGPLDLEEAADRLGEGPVVEIVERSPEMVERLKPVVDVWIAREDERLERMSLTMTVDGEPGRLVLGGDILEDDVPLDDVQAPPERLVIDEQEIPGG